MVRSSTEPNKNRIPLSQQSQSSQSTSHQSRSIISQSHNNPYSSLASASHTVESNQASSSSSLTVPHAPLLKVPALIESHSATVLFDCGSSTHFISEKFVTSHRLSTQSSTNKTKVTLADGSVKVTSQVCHNVNIQFNNHSEVMNFMVMNLPDYDAIIGMPWFEDNNPPIDWKAKTITFKPKAKTQAKKVNQSPLVPSSSPKVVKQVLFAPSVSSLETVEQPVVSSISSANVNSVKSKVNSKSNRITVPQIKMAMKRKQIEEIFLIDIQSVLDNNNSEVEAKLNNIM